MSSYEGRGIGMGNNKEESKETKQVCCGRGEQQLSHSPLEQDGACLSSNGYGKGFVTCLTNAGCLCQDVALTAYSDVVWVETGQASVRVLGKRVPSASLP